MILSVPLSLTQSQALTTPPANPESSPGVYVSFSGEVVRIEEEGGRITSLEVNHEESGIFYFTLTDRTFFVGEEFLEVGSEIEGFLKSDVPVTLIYPPRYPAEVIVVKEDTHQVKVDYFNEELISSDNLLKLNPSEDLPVTDRYGRPYEGDIASHHLIVTYTFSTRSIPAQTTPLEVVVLEENANTIFTLKVDEMPIVVENQFIDAPPAFVDDQGHVMLPLRAVSEALGFEVAWDGETRIVTLDGKITVPIGKDRYRDYEGEIHVLGAAPVIVADRTFVPIGFFKKVLAMNNAYVFEGQITIDNGEVMN
jgi:hypothetical protein